MDGELLTLGVGWKIARDPATGRFYFYNTTTGVVQWETPGITYTSSTASDASATGANGDAIEAAPGEFLTLGVGWKIAQDPVTGRFYFYNTTTREVQWEPPSITYTSSTAFDASATGANGEAIEVTAAPLASLTASPDSMGGRVVAGRGATSCAERPRVSGDTANSASIVTSQKTAFAGVLLLGVLIFWLGFVAHRTCSMNLNSESLADAFFSTLGDSFPWLVHFPEWHGVFLANDSFSSRHAFVGFFFSAVFLITCIMTSLFTMAFIELIFPQKYRNLFKNEVLMVLILLFPAIHVLWLMASCSAFSDTLIRMCSWTEAKDTNDFCYVSSALSLVRGKRVTCLLSLTKDLVWRDMWRALIVVWRGLLVAWCVMTLSCLGLVATYILYKVLEFCCQLFCSYRWKKKAVIQQLQVFQKRTTIRRHYLMTKELKKTLLCVENERLSQKEKCKNAYSELQALLVTEMAIDYAEECDRVANDMLQKLDDLHQAEQRLESLQCDVKEANEKYQELGERNYEKLVEGLQKKRKQQGQLCLDRISHLKEVSNQAVKLRLKFSTYPPPGFASDLPGQDCAGQEAENVDRARKLVEEARAQIVKCNEEAGRNMETFKQRTDAAAAKLGLLDRIDSSWTNFVYSFFGKKEEEKLGLDSSFTNSSASQAALLKLHVVREAWLLNFGWRERYFLREQDVRTANATLCVLLENLQSKLDVCCDDVRAADARLFGIDDVIKDPHNTLLLQKMERIRKELRKFDVALLDAKHKHNRLLRVGETQAAVVKKAEDQVHTKRLNLQKCHREQREIVATISRLSLSLKPELLFFMKGKHLSDNADTGNIALSLFKDRPEVREVATLFDGDRKMDHYTHVERLSRTPESRHDVDRASFNGLDDREIHVALKKYNLQREDSMKTLFQELAVLSRLKHPNIIPVNLFFHQEEEGAVYVEFPLYECDMEEWLARKSFEFHDVHAAVHDILRAIEHMHSAGVVHCDIRPKNVLMKQRMGDKRAHQVTGKWQATLGDFDVSLDKGTRATYSQTQTQSMGPRGFEGPLTMAPEVRAPLFQSCTFASDMYSYGGLLFVAFYPDISPASMPGGGVEVGEHANKDVAALVRKLLHKEPKVRPSASEALAYPLFADAGANLLSEVYDQQREVERLRQEHHKKEQEDRTDLEQKRRALEEDKRKVQELLREEEAKLQHQSAKLNEKARNQKDCEKRLHAELERVRQEEAQVKRQQARADKEANERNEKLREKEDNLRRERQQLEHGRFARPQHWTPSAGPANAVGFRLVPLQDDSVLSCLQEHLCGNGIGNVGRDQQVPGRYSRLKLARAWRVENDDLYGQYKVAQRRVISFVASVPFRGDSKARIRSELYNSSTRLAWRMEEGCNEVRLLHGTKPALVMSILQNGMNERFAGASAGTKFGDGSYFADDAGKIDQYVDVDQQYDGTSSLHKRLYSTSHSHPGHVFYALVFRVILGHSVHFADKGEASFWLNAGKKNRRELCSIPSTDPPTSYHSLIAEGSRLNLRYNEYVVFHSDLTYPEYLLAYQQV